MQEAMNGQKKQGFVYLVGAGPGDPRLITVKGLECLKRCDVVVYDHLASERLLEYVPVGCKRIFAGKQAGRHSMKQDEINRLLVEEASAGHTVVRLKGGDPFVFGRGGEEIESLKQAGICWEVVPGVTSAVAALDSAGIPITHRAVSRSFHVITGHTLEGKEDAGQACLPDGFEVYAKLTGTLVFLMGLSNLSEIVEALAANGKPPDTPAAVISRGTLPGQKTVRGTLETIVRDVQKDGQITSPAIIVVGEAAGLHMECPKDLPLEGLRIGVTGTRLLRGRLSAALEAEGALTEQILEMEVLEHSDAERMQRAYEELGQYTWLAFTSANAVEVFLNGLFKAGRDLRALGGLRLAAVGQGTLDALRRHGLLADYVPSAYTVRDLAAGISRRAGEKDRILISRSVGGSAEWNEILDAAGIPYEDIGLYEVAGRPRDAGELKIELERLDYLTFSSASGVEAFFKMAGEDVLQAFPKVRTACIGLATSAALERHGRRADVTAAQFSAEGLVRALCEHIHAEIS